MKHYEPGKPYPRKRTDSGPAVRRHSAAAYARREMRRKQIRRNRILFGVLLVILAGLIFAAVHLTLKDKGEELSLIHIWGWPGEEGRENPLASRLPKK